jgi:hypothetical protein
VSTQTPPHIALLSQAQAALTQDWPEGHATPALAPLQLPDAPQWLGSFLPSMQAPPHWTRFAPQVVVHVPLLHTVPAPQALPQVPQFSLSVAVLAQYGVPPSGEHVAKEPQVRPHVPFPQTVPGGHALPHSPQLALSVAVLAQ